MRGKLEGEGSAAAILVGPRVSSAFARGGWTFVHGETQAGTPACAAAVTAVIDELYRIDVDSTTAVLGRDLSRLAATLKSDGLITDVTGAGCFLGLALRDSDAAPILRISTVVGRF